ncbi:MAG TPA: LuxR C-terminal-related transcriptional regulator [Chloroflexota bacterium]
MLDVDRRLEEAREAFARRAWRDARSGFAVVSHDAMTLDDIERHAIAAHLVGYEPESRELLGRGHREALARDDVTRAVRFAFWLGHSMIFTGELAQASGWWSRARTLLAQRGVDCAEWGLVLFTEALQQFFAGDADAALRTLTEAETIGQRFADTTVLASAQYLRGRALIRQGNCREGMAALDEVMVAATNGELHLLNLGHAYCGLLQACWEVLDLRRAREWTGALTRWCDGQPDLVPYRGPCLVHRVELMCMHGDWTQAMEEARRACDWLSQPESPETPADATYQLGELHRLRGEFAAAEQAYREASQLGISPQPGLALVWLAHGRTEAAASAVRRALDEAQECGKRAELLAAYVEILLAVGDVVSARSATNEMKELARTVDALLLRAIADRAEGSVLLAENQARAAVGALRRSWQCWQQLEAPYEAARTRVLIARACRALEDTDSASMELEAARSVFERLGAMYELEELDDGAKWITRSSYGLTAREIEVLGLVAAGETNKAIAAALVISEYTVARHVQNMLQKLGCSSRSGLTAFAVEHGLAHRISG